MEKQFKGVVLLTAITTLGVFAASAQNLITNGDFELGNTGFSTDYSYSPGNIWWEGEYDIVTSPSNSHIGAASFADHTSGTGRMIALNGSLTPSMRLWSETVKVEPNHTYTFSGWSATWGHNPGTTYDPNPPKLLVFINGVQQGSAIQVAAENGQWQNFKVVWNSQAATQAVIELQNYNTGYEGNDLALDDLSFTVSAPPITDSRLVAYYPFNGNANDAVGTNNGFVVGARLATNRFGQTNNAYSFDGTSAHISFAAVPLDQMDHWTISAWMKPSTLVQLGNVVTLGYNDQSAYTANGVAFGMSCVNSYTWDTAGSNFTATLGGVDWIASGYSFPTTSNWYQITMTRDAGVIKFFVNGIQTSYASLSVPILPTAFTIGAANFFDGRRSFNGLIDDVRIYNAALSTNEVQQLYASESTPPYATNGLVAYYPFNGDANDAVGTNNGFVVGAKLASNRFGQTNCAYNFDGTGAHISFEAVPLDQMDHWTISAWMKPSKLVQIGDVVNVGYNDQSADSANGIAFGMSCVNPSTWDTAGSNFTATTGGVDWIASGYSFASTNAWYHLVMKRQNGVIKFYVNGVQTAYTSQSVPRLPTDFTIGSANYLDGYRSFNGLIDDVRIYNTALSDSEVQHLYASESAPPFVTNGLVAYYPFNGDVNDASGRGHNGTNYGAQITLDRFGNTNSAILLDGQSTCVGIPYSSDFDFQGDGQFSMAAWFKINGSGSGYHGISSLVVKCPRQGPSDFYGVWDYGMCTFYENEPDLWAGLQSGISVSSQAPVATGVWQQGVVTYSNADWRLYLNGALISQSHTPYTITRSTGGLAIGRKGDVPLDYFNGAIDEVRIYNRALSGSEVQQLYTYELPVSQQPSITTQPQSVTVNAHQDALFNVAVLGAEPFSYQWAFNGTNIPGAKSDTLRLTNVVQTNLGAYSVTVSNAYGSVISSNAILSMKPFIQIPFSGIVGYWGKDTTLSVQVWGTGPITYRWYKDGVMIPNATNATLTLKSLQFTNAGAYSVVVTSPFGSVTNSASQLVVNPAGVSLGMYPGVVVSGVVGYTYSIQSTTNLNDTNSWVTAATLTLMQPEQLWVDVKNNATSPTNQHRFYRVVAGQ